MSTSRERFLQQLERCVRYQNESIILPDPPRASDDWNNPSEYIAPEQMGNGQPDVHVDTQTVWGLRPPGEEAPDIPLTTGDWA